MAGSEQGGSDYDKALRLCLEGLSKYRDLDFDGAIKDLKKSLILIGDDDEETYKLFGHLGSVYFAKKQYEEALVYQKKAMQTLKKLGNANPEELRGTFHNMSQTYKKLREYEKAVKCFHEEIKLIGKDHTDVCSIYREIGDAYRLWRRDDQACNFYEKCIKRASSATDIAIAPTYNNLGSIYLAQSKNGMEETAANSKKKVKACNLFLKSLACYEESLGLGTAFGYDPEGHAAAINNLASAYVMLGKIPDAVKMLKKSIAINTKTYGANSAKTKKAQTDLQLMESLDPALFAGPAENFLNGTREFDNATCAGCSKTGLDGLKCCSKCKKAFYCSSACQVKDWKALHKKECKKLVSLNKAEKVLEKCDKNAKKKAKDGYKFGEIVPEADERLHGEAFHAHHKTIGGCNPPGSMVKDNLPPITLETPPMLRVFGAGSEKGFATPLLTVHKNMKFVVELVKIPANVDPSGTYEQARGGNGGIFIRIVEKYTSHDAKYKLARPQAFQLYILGEVVFTKNCFKEFKKYLYDDGGCRGADFEWPDHRAVFMCPVTRKVAVPDGKTSYILCWQPLSAVFRNRHNEEVGSSRVIPRLLSMEGYRQMMSKRNNCNSKVKMPVLGDLNRQLECFPDAQNSLEESGQSWVPRPKSIIDFRNFMQANGGIGGEAKQRRAKKKYDAAIRKRGGDPTSRRTGFVVPTVYDLFQLAEDTNCRLCTEYFTSTEFHKRYQVFMKVFAASVGVNTELRNKSVQSKATYANPLTPIIDDNAKCVCGNGKKYKKCCGVRSIKLQKRRVEDKDFPVGLEVTFRKLNAKAMNGVYATVVKEYNEETGRIACKRQDNGKLVSVKPENLVTKFIHPPS